MQTKRKGYIIAAILSIALALALPACSANNGADGAASNDAIASSDNIGAEGDAAAGAEGGQAAEPGDDLVITVSEISEAPTFYPVEADGTRMEVFAVKASDGTIRTAFNTCQVCNGSPKAYFEQVGDAVQCQNCGNEFPMSRIGIESGGCNPVPILDGEKTVEEETITIPYGTLQANAYRFPENWKA